MKVLVTSDTHGYLPEITEPFDLLLICGDVCPAHDHYFSYQIQWIETVFAPWVKNLPFRDEWSKVVMTWGNHDFVGERANKTEIDNIQKIADGRLVILKNKDYDFEYLDENEGIKTLKIFGIPYCKIFGSWAFMVSNEKLREKYSMMPDNTDIFITHDSPKLNNLGMIQQGWNAGVDAGNPVLDEIILEKKPKYVFSGHIHSGNHNYEEVEGIMMANVSYIDEHYKPAYPILEFEI